MTVDRDEHEPGISAVVGQRLWIPSFTALRILRQFLDDSTIYNRTKAQTAHAPHKSFAHTLQKGDGPTTTDHDPRSATILGSSSIPTLHIRHLLQPRSLIETLRCTQRRHIDILRRDPCTLDELARRGHGGVNHRWVDHEHPYSIEASSLRGKTRQLGSREKKREKPYLRAHHRR